MYKTPKRYLLFLAVCTVTNLSAQGILINEASNSRYENLPRQPDFNDGGKTEDKALTGITEWSLKAYCPKPRHQGSTGNCVGWSVGYAALTIQQAIANNWKGQTDLITKNAFSPMFIYNQIKIADCQQGAYIDAAMNLLQQKGDVLARDFDKSINDCTVMPTSEDLVRAAQNKIIDFRTLFAYQASQQIKVNKVKLSLVQNRPVVIGINLLNNFATLRSKDTYWNPTSGDQERFGGHALVVVGFDDSRGAFEVMNSWGETWGNKGYMWIRYEDFANYVHYGFQMDLSPNFKKEQQYAGKFSLRRFEAMMTNGEALFSEEKVALKKGIYQLQSQAVTTGTIFQLLVSQTTANTYLYAMGVEPDGAVKTYWPKSNESACLPFNEVDLYIPGTAAGLQFKQVGIEHLVVLFSAKPIPNLRANMKRVGKMKGPLLDRLKAVFGAYLRLPKDVNYDQSTMKFIQPTLGNSIIPMVLQMKIDC